MIAIFKKEMKSYFTTVTGYVFLGVALLISGFVLSITTFMSAEPTSDTSSYFSLVLIMSMVFLPILTMRSFSDDRRTKTDQLLFTSPVSVFSLVLGKFFWLDSTLKNIPKDVKKLFSTVKEFPVVAIYTFFACVICAILNNYLVYAILLCNLSYPIFILIRKAIRQK